MTTTELIKRLQGILETTDQDPEVVIVESGKWLPIESITGEESHGSYIWLYTPSDTRTIGGARQPRLGWDHWGLGVESPDRCGAYYGTGNPHHPAAVCVRRADHPNVAQDHIGHSDAINYDGR